MLAVLLLGCTAAGLALYFGIVRPLLVPLSWRIATHRAYRPTFAHGVR